MMALVGISAMSGQSQEICTESVARREEKINAEDAEVTESKARCFKSQNRRENVFLGGIRLLAADYREHAKNTDVCGFSFVPFASSALIFSVSSPSQMPAPEPERRCRRRAWPRATNSPPD